MRDYKLPYEEKARIAFERNVSILAKHYGISYEEVLKKWDKEGGSQKRFDKELRLARRTQSLIDQLKRQDDFLEINDVPVMYFNTDPDYNGPAEDSPVVNLRQGEIVLASDIQLMQADFILREHLIYRNVRAIGCDSLSQRVKALRSKLETVLNTGFDKPLDTTKPKVWMSYYLTKVFEYSEEDWPKLITGYYPEGVEYIGGTEGHEWRFLKDPKEVLACLLLFFRLHPLSFPDQKKKLKPKMIK